MMRFYKQQHAFYCGVDLHAKTMHVCVVNQAGEVIVHRNLPTRPDRFLNALAPYTSQDIVVACECLFSWYWLADLCTAEKIPFVLGHALYMKAIHGAEPVRQLLSPPSPERSALIGPGRPCALRTT